MHYSLIIKEKKVKMSFLRVSDLLFAVKSKIMLWIHRYISLKVIFSLKINEKLPLEKCVCLLLKILTAWFPA